MIYNIALVILAFAAHELGHVLAAWWFGVRVRKIGVGRLGAYVQRARTAGWPEILICLAGPSMNLALAIAFAHRSPWFMLCNATFCWVNLLPIANSDGTHAIEAFSDMRWKQLVDRVGASVGVE